MKHLRIFNSISDFESKMPSLDAPYIAFENGGGDVFIEKFEFVDLGLPSGLKWAKCNVGAETETDAGLYFQWGYTEGHDKDSEFFLSQLWNYGYKNKVFKDLTIEYDAANVNMGGGWRMPTKDEFNELMNNTNVTQATINDVVGYKFTCKTDASKYIFMPECGTYYQNTFWNKVATYWTSSYYGYNYENFVMWRFIAFKQGETLYKSVERSPGSYATPIRAVKS